MVAEPIHCGSSVVDCFGSGTAGVAGAETEILEDQHPHLICRGVEIIWCDMGMHPDQIEAGRCGEL
jgi:hypothetical protein